MIEEVARFRYEWGVSRAREYRHGKFTEMVKINLQEITKTVSIL